MIIKHISHYSINLVALSHTHIANLKKSVSRVMPRLCARATRYWHKILVQPQLLSQNAWYTFRGMYEVTNHRRGTSTQAATPTAFSVFVQVRLELYIFSLVFSNLFSNRLRHPCPVPVFYACTLYSLGTRVRHIAIEHTFQVFRQHRACATLVCSIAKCLTLVPADVKPMYGFGRDSCAAEFKSR
jgi:hypothetical protein